MNILFLDFDGVLNSKQHILAIKGKEIPGQDNPDEADLECMKFNTNSNNIWCLKYIMDKVPDLKIVLSTSWRNHFDMEQFKELFKFYGLDGKRIIGKTPKKFSSERHSEIGWWLEDNNFIGRWIALDDHPIYNLDDSNKYNEILTDPWVGLTMNDAFIIIKRFNPNFEEPVVLL